MSRARTRLLLGGALALFVVIAIGLALFQPWKLWVDDRVDEAAPLGATPVTASPPTSAGEAPRPSTTAGTATPATTAGTGTPATTVAAAAAPDPTVVPAPDDPPATSAAPSTAPVATAFVSLDHQTSGGLLILADPQGRRFVRFVDLATDNGPDLKVYLSSNPVDGPEGVFDDDFVDLGRLQGNLGSQNYELPADADLARFRSVVIWCDRFNSAFGAAPLP